ncbi:NACHT, LRR and PYD domains-containing protein 12-like isoform X2 [Ornithorhynchus anatinus]|uniref:NACHT, LRR and PYD domains-containing protein 12-like isoform X2 n=1 Tax=Ornithorhynchus anatinus TaxID=9258 RepID=UPI0010A8FD8F|nr:NACHT, LRR and PYD domains-containing protein 12-like isoform X2 [Ornithorhynchus anatinus]
MEVSLTELHFVDQPSLREQLIQRVTSVDQVLDKLFGSVLSQEQYQLVRAESTNPNKMRTLFSFSPSWTQNCKDLLLKALREIHGPLLKELERSPEMQSPQDGAAIRKRYRARMEEKFSLLRERNARPGESVVLQHIFTQLLCLPEHPQREQKEHELLAVGWDHARTMEEKGQFVEVNALFGPDKIRFRRPKTIVLQGAAGIGKTMLARKIMLDWAKGNFFEDIFQFVFYLNCREMNQLSERSLSDLISVHLGDPRASFDEIMSQPEKLLFIVDGFDELKWSFEEQEYDLCYDWSEKRPVPILMSSLLRKILLPEAYLLITSRLTSLEALNNLLQHPYHVEILGFSEADRKEYFCRYFGDENQAMQAFDLVKDNETLFTMCFVPLVCWIVCTCLKQQLKCGKDLTQTSRTTTDLYVNYLAALFPATQDRPSQDPPILRRLCHLAAEGVWTQKILFDGDDLRKHGLDMSDVSPFLQLSIFQKDIDCENSYSFIHLSFQEFFAAMFYALGAEEEAMDDSITDIGDVKKLLEENEKSQWKGFLTLTVRFLFGLLNEARVKDLEKKFNCKISQEIKKELLQWSKGHCEILDLETLFDCLYEIQEKEFIRTVMNRFQRIHLEIDTRMKLLVSSFCIKHCQTLQSIRIGGGDLGMTYFGEAGCPVKQAWKDLFSGLRTNQDLTELTFSKLFIESGMETLCEELRHPQWKIRTIRLDSCDLTAADCQGLSSAFASNQSLKYLDLIFDDPENTGVKWLFEALRHTDCSLEALGLQRCHLTVASCKDLSSALASNQKLKRLYLTNCDLNARAVKSLCEGLRHPNCSLEILGLQSCGLRDACYEDLSSILTGNKKLTRLDLFGNLLSESVKQRLQNDSKHANFNYERKRF